MFNGLGFFKPRILTKFLFQIRLDNIALHLIEDRPSPNITSPGSLPIDVAIPALTITRDKSGMFSVQSAGKKLCTLTGVFYYNFPLSTYVMKCVDPLKASGTCSLCKFYQFSYIAKVINKFILLTGNWI